MPETIHTSPDHVLTAARPSGKKSTPPKRIQAFQGFFSGTVMVSMTYGCVAALTSPLVMTGSVHRAGPGFKSVSMSSAGCAATFVRLNDRVYVAASFRGGNVANWPSIFTPSDATHES